ncbi:LysR family transcriptional regulator [uncultured Tateyamaria sp.]|uniref:LysR family transcriptional regulator n=1 Tax=uncultured Tateyamaria sp. TaxID=455651 RepID=UPI0026282A02|nr:LysR family transcriptional regulator [uncultured Tateyamaria sp.]
MNLQALRTFLAIVETGSLVRASERLNVTQSTVTARLKTLEDDLGQTLLIRNKSGATLTAAGLSLHRYADTIVKLWQQARQETALPDGMSGVCNLACEFDLWLGLGDRRAQTLMDQFPDLGISIWLGSQSDVMKWLDEGKSDLAFTYRSACPSAHEQMTLKPDELVLVSTDPNGPVRFDPKYVLVDAGEAFGREHAIHYADAGTARISFGNASIAQEHILRNGGSAYLPWRSVEGLVEEGRLFRLPDAPAFSRAVFLTHNRRLKDSTTWFDLALGALLGLSS